MDALAINEENEVDYCSSNGKMHACGHDIQLLHFGTTLILNLKNEFNGTIKLVFQPGEKNTRCKFND